MNELALTAQDYASLSPFLVLVGTSLLLLLAESFLSRGAKIVTPILTTVGFLIALICTLKAPEISHPLLTPWVNTDATSRLFTLLFLGIGIGSVALSSPFFKMTETSRGEYYFLLTAAVFGLLLIGSSADFLTLFIGIETLSLALYVLCGYLKKWELSQESALKYFLLGALSSAFLLFGIALVYGAVGTTGFENLLANFKTLEQQKLLLFLSGVALITLGFAFKAAIVPFHIWAPDVYEGAPTPVTAFMAVGTKAGAFAAFVRVFIEALPQFDPKWQQLIVILAITTLIYANWVALKQTQLRRFFAYSGISHAGFLLIGVAAGTSEATQALLFYLVIYALATFGAFAVMALCEKRREGLWLKDLTGLFRQSPILAGVMALSLLTLAGIPPTAGFFAKFYLFKVAFSQGLYGVVLVGLVTAIVAAFYYTRIIAMMFMEPAKEEGETIQPVWPTATLAFACFALMLWLSIYPAPIFAVLALF